MQRKRLLWQIFPSYLLITLLALLAITWYASTSLRKFFYSQTEQDLLARAKLVIELTQNLNPQEDRQEVESICREMSKLSKTQILFILRNGTVLGDNTDSADAEENILIRPEVQKALNGAQGLSTRFNTILRKKMMFLAIPCKQGPIIVGVVRTSIPISPIDKALAEVYLQITLAGIIIALISAVVSLIVSRRISRPLEEMKKVSVEFANGNLHRRLPILNSEEIG
ncbi:HAMP domain-containing protein, partial [bacterium]|nr:HAMP domain-containing protein [bacterium]